MLVRIQSLKNGLNEFKFNPDSTEIELNDESVGVVKASISSNVDNGDQNIIVTNDIIVKVSIECETCLEKYETDLEDSYTVFYTSEERMFDNDEMSRLLNRNTQEIDLTEGLREAILVSLPMRFKCSIKCAGLCDQCGVNLNIKKCKCEKVSFDPRWEGLKKIFQEKTGVNRLN